MSSDRAENRSVDPGQASPPANGLKQTKTD